MRKLPIGMAASTALMFAGTASAVIDLDANIAGIFTDSSFSTPVPGAVIDPSGDSATASLAAGQGILITIDVENANGDFIQELSSSIVIDGGQMFFLGGNVNTSSILVGGPASMPTSLESFAIPWPMSKNDQPSCNGCGGPHWIQATAYGSALGTDGTGPDYAIASLFFLVTGASGIDEVVFDMTMTAGDSISPSSGLPIFSDAVINPIPEPGTALLMGLGLAGLAAAGRRNA